MSRDKARQIAALMVLNPEHAVEIIEGLLEELETLKRDHGAMLDEIIENGRRITRDREEDPRAT